jgi:ornithine--oxo-acid transaminase
MKAADYVALEERYGAHNYHPLPVVLAQGDGVWVEDVEGNRYMDMLSAYSAVNQGHNNARILAAARKQLDRLTLTSRAFHNDQLGPFCEQLANLTGMDRVLPMNTGAEAVETAIKAARRWSYDVKGVPPDAAEIIVCADNFHGRTTTIVSFSTDGANQRGFGPLTPGFRVVPYGDIEALRSNITANTAAFLVEPIQGEAGVIIPPAGYFAEVRALCTENNVLLMADEIQTGLGRTGRLFACEHEAIRPDVYILGKALGGGVVPVSAVASSDEVLGVFEPGSHGSTFGGNPLACAVAREALDVLVEEGLPARAETLGQVFRSRLEKLVGNGIVLQVRGRGLLNAIDIDPAAGAARTFCERLREAGILAKETHHTIIRFAPPLVLSADDLEWALGRIEKVLSSS